MAQVYMERLNIPEKSFRDAAHLGIACTPEELMEV
ncbi:hypothetical protein C5S53_12745 [Methanophagales archaeon]|nr:hypothetical protein C5S53_12745 [Methanophagales archaeon]